MAKSKLIRQLSLLAFLLNRKYPVDWQTIKKNIPEYSRMDIKEDSLVRKFARDKEDLRRMGIPIETISTADDFGNRYEGYILRWESYYLPELKLTRPEANTLQLAMQAILSLKDFPLRSFALSAQKKLVFDLIPEEEQCGHILFQWSEQKDKVKKYLSELHNALFMQKQTTIDYYTIRRNSKNKRVVNPYGLMFREGIWYLIGFDHLRKQERTFRIERINSLSVNKKNPAKSDYAIPESFSMKQYMGRESWRLIEGKPLEVIVRFDSEISPMVLQWYQKKNKVVKTSDGGCEVAFLTTQMDSLVRHILGFKERAEIISPKSASEYAKNVLNEIKKIYQ